jgi:hypothetical protein
MAGNSERESQRWHPFNPLVAGIRGYRPAFAGWAAHALLAVLPDGLLPDGKGHGPQSGFSAASAAFSAASTAFSAASAAFIAFSAAFTLAFASSVHLRVMTFVNICRRRSLRRPMEKRVWPRANRLVLDTPLAAIAAGETWEWD